MTTKVYIDIGNGSMSMLSSSQQGRPKSSSMLRHLYYSAKGDPAVILAQIVEEEARLRDLHERLLDHCGRDKSIEDDRGSVKKLMKEGADPSFNSNYAIGLAARSGYYNALVAILRHPSVAPGRYDEKTGIHPLIAGSMNGHFYVVRLLLIFYWSNEVLRSAMDHARSINRYDIVELIAGEQGRHPSMKASFMRREEVEEYDSQDDESSSYDHW